jgi:hypothetical protein
LKVGSRFSPQDEAPMAAKWGRNGWRGAPKGAGEEETEKSKQVGTVPCVMMGCGAINLSTHQPEEHIIPRCCEQLGDTYHLPISSKCRPSKDHRAGSFVLAGARMPILVLMPTKLGQKLITQLMLAN